MEAVSLHFQAPGDRVSSRIDLPLVVVHMPKPRHARVEASDTPIFDQLLEEIWPRNYTLF
jgi:hypothetical protein